MADKYQKSIDIINRMDPSIHQNSLYFAACVSDHEMGTKITKLLIENGIFEILMQFSLKTCYMKSEGGRITVKDSLKQSPFFYVCREGNLELFDYYLSKGADINEKDNYGQNPLFYVTREGRLELAKYMVEKGANINQVDNIGQICTFYAASEGRVKTLEWLYDLGLDVNHSDNHRLTALYWAKKNQKHEVAEMLIARGALNTKDGKMSQKEMAKFKKSTQTSGLGSKQQSTMEIEEYKSGTVSQPVEVVSAPIAAVTPPVEEPSKQSGSNLVKRKPLKEKEVSRTAYKLYKTDAFGNPKELTYKELKEYEASYPDFIRFVMNPESFSTDLDSWEMVARKIFAQLWKAKGAYLFHKPVDPSEFNIKDYFDIIKNPMDFGTIKERLNKKHYQSISEFVSDMNLVFDNCIRYNGANSEVGIVGVVCKKQLKNACDTFNVNRFLQNSRMEEEPSTGQIVESSLIEKDQNLANAEARSAVSHSAGANGAVLNQPGEEN